MRYILMGSPLSPFVRKVRVFCAEKSIDYDLDPVNPFSPPDGWREISPLNRIPVLALEDDDLSRRFLPDSSVICAFLDQMFPEHPLIPEAPFARGEALWFEEYADSDLAAAIGAGIFQPIVFSRMQGKEPDEAKARDTIENRLPRFLDYLESQVGDNEYLVEQRFTIADISTATSFVNMSHAGFSPDASHWPKFSAYLERILSRTSFAECIAGERKTLGL